MERWQPVYRNWKSRTAINLKVGTNEQQNIIINPIIYLRYLFTNAQSSPIPMGRRDGNPDLSWLPKEEPKPSEGKIFQAADYGLKNDDTR